MGDSMKSNKFTTVENRRKRQSWEEVFKVPFDNVAEVFGEESD